MKGNGDRVSVACPRCHKPVSLNYAILHENGSLIVYGKCTYCFQMGIDHMSIYGFQEIDKATFDEAHEMGLPIETEPDEEDK